MSASEVTLAAIRRRLATVEVAQRFGLELRRDGSGRHLAPCPFHEAEEPTLTISDSGFECSECGARGDSIKLYVRLAGEDRSTAVRTLAGQLGIPIAVDESASGPSRPVRDRGKVITELEQLGDEPDLAATSHLLRELSLSVLGLDQLEHAATREAAIRALRGKLSAPAALVDAALRSEAVVESADDGLQGGAPSR